MAINLNRIPSPNTPRCWGTHFYHSCAVLKSTSSWSPCGMYLERAFVFFFVRRFFLHIHEFSLSMGQSIVISCIRLLMHKIGTCKSYRKQRVHTQNNLSRNSITKRRIKNHSLNFKVSTHKKRHITNHRINSRMSMNRRK